MLFPAVLIDFSNLKVCLIGEWSIVNDWMLTNSWHNAQRKILPYNFDEKSAYEQEQ